MSARRIHLAWFLHQPYFIPDDEVRWRIHSTYRPLVDELVRRKISVSFGITAGLLERCIEIEPQFAELLVELSKTKKIRLLGTASDHAFVPWLPTSMAKLQIAFDKQLKRHLGFQASPTFWPPELAWSTKVGLLAREAEYSEVVVDSSIRSQAMLIPVWREGGSGLVPRFDMFPKLATVPKVRLDLGSTDDRCDSVVLWIRERALSNTLLEITRAEAPPSAPGQSLADAIDTIHLGAANPAAPLLLADDPERHLPNGLSRLLDLLDDAPRYSIEFVTPDEFAQWPVEADWQYAPASTMEGGDDMWNASLDDRCFREYLSQVTIRFENQRANQNNSDVFAAIQRELMRLQDTGFYVWHNVPRTRASSYTKLRRIETWMEVHE